MNRTMNKNNIHRRPGMILLLVVAVLVLLALMGTVYILSASTDKQVSYASNDQANLNYATEGMLSVVRADILNSTLSTNGGGTNGYPLQLGGTSPARVWTGPDIGYLANGMIANPMEDPTATSAAAAGTAPTPGTNPQIASEPWLCGAMPLEPNTVYAPGATAVKCVPGGLPLTAPPAMTDEVYSGTTPGDSSSASGNSFTPRLSGSYTPLISYLTSALYDPTDGQYDLGYESVQTGAPSNSGLENNGSPIEVPNASVVMPAATYSTSLAANSQNPLTPFGTLDAMWNMLPYSSPNGTHYRFAVRVMDLSAKMNVNTGWIANDTTAPAPSHATTGPNGAGYLEGGWALDGTAFAAYPIYAVPGTYNPADASATANMQAPGLALPTRAGTYNPTNYDLLDWQRALNYYESQGVPYTSASVQGASLNLYGPGTELQWLAYGGAGGQFGLLASNRLATQMPNTFGTIPYGSGYQDFYTTYSWSRQYASTEAAATMPSLTAGMTTLYPSRVNLNADISTAAQAGGLAEQLYAAMNVCGFSSHAQSYVANYMTYRFGTAGSSTANSGPAVVGPGSVNTIFGASTSNLNTGNNYYIGNEVQPFINELELYVNQTAGGTPTVKGYGIELSNPFPQRVGLTGWKLLVTGSGTAPASVSLDTMVDASGNNRLAGYTAANDDCYGVAYNGTNSGIASGAATENITTLTAGNFPLSGKVYLLAPCPSMPALGNIPAGYAVVDEFDYQLPAAEIQNGSDYYDASRNNTSEWSCDSGTSTAVTLALASGSQLTLGAANSLSTAGGASPGMPLYSRSDPAVGDPVDPSFVPDAANGYVLLNWADANCIARECSIETSSGVAEPIAWQIGANTALPIPTNVPGYNQIANEGLLARLYFDFPFDSRAALTSADMPTTGVVEPNVLTMFSLGTRADDPTVTPTGVANANLLTRTPGRINVNTAGEVPLYDAIFDPAAGLLKSAANGSALDSQLVADTIAYRDRLAAQSNFPIFTSNGTGVTVSTSGTTPAYDAYPGYNIKSLGDLLLAWLPTLEQVNGTPPTSFLQRDILWADCANNFCVHSDTFAVYGLVQAIRLNPNYVSNGGAYNVTDWYNASQEMPYSDAAAGSGGQYVEQLLAAQTPTVTSGTETIFPEFIVEGQRRFVAIVDSSYSTPPGGTGPPPAPKIVAIKYLPQ